MKDKWIFSQVLTMFCVGLHTALFVLVYAQYSSGGSPSSPCSLQHRTADVTTCLEAIRKRAEDPSMFWFGKGYASSCQGRGQFAADCYNPRATAADSLVTRLFKSRAYNPEKVDRFLEVTYFTSKGKYKACENEFTYQLEREFTLDPMTMIVMSPYELRHRPKLWWKTDPNELYTLVFYDAGYLNVKALYINIPGSNVTNGEELVEYEGPLNPTKNENPYIFMVFKQREQITLADKWKELLTQRNWQEELDEFTASHELEGPIALSWVLVSGDPYAAEVKRTRGYMNTCSYYVSEAFREKDIQFIPNATYNRETLDLNVYVNVTFEASPVFVNSCCSDYSYPSRTFSLNPIGDDTVLPAHTRGGAVVYVTLTMATAFPDTQRDFEDKNLTLAMVDPDVPLQEFGNPRLPFLHWLVTNIRGADVAAGDVVQGYMGPAPPDPKPHRYFFLLFEQPQELDPKELDFSAVNCSWAFRGRCRFDVMTMVSEHNLKLVGASWMTARFDEFVRELYIQAGMTPRCSACHGVPGYENPCPSHGNAITARKWVTMAAGIVWLVVKFW